MCFLCPRQMSHSLLQRWNHTHGTPSDMTILGKRVGTLACLGHIGLDWARTRIQLWESVLPLWPADVRETEKADRHSSFKDTIVQKIILKLLVFLPEPLSTRERVEKSSSSVDLVSVCNWCWKVLNTCLISSDSEGPLFCRKAEAQESWPFPVSSKHLNPASQNHSFLNLEIEPFTDSLPGSGGAWHGFEHTEETQFYSTSGISSRFSFQYNLYPEVHWLVLKRGSWSSHKGQDRSDIDWMF